MLKPLFFTGIFCILTGSFQVSPALAAECGGRQAESWVQVNVFGILSDEGNLRAQIYGDNPEDFLRKGKKLVRIDVPSMARQADLCVPLPGPGRYSLVVMHDRNANGRADFYTDGFGFSNNPHISIAAPDLSDTLFTADKGGMTLDVFLGYMLFGRLSPGDPWATPDTGQNGSPQSAH